MKYLTSFLILAVCLAGCNSSSDPAGQAEAHDHGAISILLFNGGMELFAETDQLYARHAVNVRAHLTFLEGYAPAQKGVLYARIAQGQDSPGWVALELARSGIYTGVVSPQDPGPCSFDFRYVEDGLEVIFTMDSLYVYSHGEEPAAEDEHHDAGIFTKEQSWRTEFGLMPVELKDFSRSIHCSGEVIIPPHSVVKVVSPAKGRINFIRKDLAEGAFIKKGDILFTLSGTGLSHDNINLEYTRAKVDYERSLANFERKETLLKIGAVSEKDFEEAKAILEQDRARFELLESLPGDGGLVVASPVSGFVSGINAANNDFAETGTILLELLKAENVRVKAHLPANESMYLSTIRDANMKFTGDPNIYSLEELGGKKLSFSHMVEPGSGMVPVYFELSRTDLIAGTFVELWLKTETIADQVVIPGSGLIEEYGNYFVYVQEGGEVYEKRNVTINGYDGKNYLVTGGIKPGEVIVSKGAMAIKVANSMGSAPVHSH